MFDTRREILGKFIPRRVIANDRANLHLIFVITLVTRRPCTRELHGHADNAADPDRWGVDRDTKEIRIPRNDLIRRGRRTGIIITLLPISSETAADEGARGAAGPERESDQEEEEEEEEEEQGKKKEGESERARGGETGSARSRAFRSRHPVYRSAVRDAGPMAWRSWQIIITNHQLFARNG